MRDDYTIGVEEEYQLVDSETGALRSRARDVLSTDWTEELKGELHETTVEIGTPISETWEDVRAHLGRQRFQTATAAAAEGLGILAAGLHPFSRWEAHEITAGERYADIADRHDRVARELQIFGMHVHVGIPDRVNRLRVMDRVRAFCPHLLALSASSPFLEAEDTGFASYRGVLWRLYPFMGIPPSFDDEADFGRHVRMLIDSGAIRDEASIYWSIRPHGEYPTLEFRSPDPCPRVEDAATVAALVRLVVVAAAEHDIVAPGGAPGGMREDRWREVLTENEWQAARYGLDAELVAPGLGGGGRLRLAEGVRRLLGDLEPVAAELGETAVLGRVEALLERGSGADRMREVLDEEGSFAEVVKWLMRETRLGTGADRRRSQRAAEG